MHANTFKVFLQIILKVVIFFFGRKCSAKSFEMLAQYIIISSIGYVRERGNVRVFQNYFFKSSGYEFCKISGDIRTFFGTLNVLKNVVFWG